MQAEDRVIHFSTELIHKKTQHTRQALQALYYELSQKSPMAYDGCDFSKPTQARLFSKRGKAQSLALFLPDRVVLMEEWADLALSGFIAKVQTVTEGVFAGLNIEAIIGQAVTLRSTFALTHFTDAREFLLEHICQQASPMAEHFQRPVASGGLRFVLPETPDYPGTLHVAIESFRHDGREVFVEIKGVFGHRNITPDTASELRENIQLCRNFILHHIQPYLSQYDTPKEGLV